MPKLERYNSIEELKAASNTSGEIDTAAFEQYKAFIDLLRTSLAEKKTKKRDIKKNKEGHG